LLYASLSLLCSLLSFLRQSLLSGGPLLSRALLLFLQGSSSRSGGIIRSRSGRCRRCRNGGWFALLTQNRIAKQLDLVGLSEFQSANGPNAMVEASHRRVDSAAQLDRLADQLACARFWVSACRSYGGRSEPSALSAKRSYSVVHKWVYIFKSRKAKELPPDST
jgi:hypothetical protein